MKDPITTPGKTYAVTSPNGCTVTTENGLTLAEIEAGKQGYFVAVSGKVLLSDEAAVLTQLFKSAPQQRLAILGVLGGNGGLPAGYKRVEYLESTSTQYIDSGKKPDENTGVEAVHWSSDAGYDHFYAGIGQKSKWFFPSILRSSAVGNTSYGYGWSNWNGKGRSTVMVKSTGRLNFYNNKRASLQNDTEATFDDVISAALPDFSSNILVFAANNNGVPSFFYHGKLYSLKISQGQNIARDFVPCLDSTGAPCMFDLVSRKPFYNEGTGDFLYPTESTTYALRRVLPDWGKLTENGLRRLYHAPASYQGELYDYALANGFKPIIETEQPEDGYWAPQWTETEDEIVLEWVETEPPMEELTETE